MKTIFIFSAVFILYTYLGYPTYLIIKSKLHPRFVRKGFKGALPSVSIVIAAKNEANNIERRLENLLEVEYPVHLYEIIVVSDGSDDETNNIVQRFSADQNPVKLITYFPSEGKPAALNRGVRESQGEIIVFGDSRQSFEKRAVPELAANFSDPIVGCVSGELVFLEGPDSSIQKEMGAYWHYEKMVRKLESRTGSVAGATGAIYAIRRELYKDIPHETILDDVLIPMNTVMQGYRCVFDPSAIAYDFVSRDMQSELARKIRTLAGNWQLLALEPKLMLPVANKIWWGFLSHKIFRLLVPFFLIYLFLANFFLGGAFFMLTLAGQLLFYSAFAVACFKPSVREKRPINLIYFFVHLNYAALAGTWYFLSGNTAKIWKKA